MTDPRAVTSADDVADALHAHGYLPDEGLATAVFLAVSWWAGWFLRGREPLLIERLAPRALN